MNEAVERGTNYDWKHEAWHLERELEKSRDLVRQLDMSNERMAMELESLKAECASLREAWQSVGDWICLTRLRDVNPDHPLAKLENIFSWLDRVRGGE